MAYYALNHLDSHLTLAPTSPKRAVVYMKESVNKNKKIISQVMAAHAILFILNCTGIWNWKGTVIKLLESGIVRSHIGDPNATMDDVKRCN